MEMNITNSINLYNRSKKFIPGGVNSPVRSFNSVGGNPIFFKRAEGPYLFDVDGNKYVDCICSWGPMILGHAHPEVVKEVQDVVKDSFSFGAPTEIEYHLAEMVCEMAPGVDQVRMVNSGTEACMSAIRLARAYTGKEKFLKFEGNYHGHADPFLIKAGSGLSTFGFPSSPGVTRGTTSDTIPVRYNDLEDVKSKIEQYKGSIAAIILEPIAGNMGCIPPHPEFLKGLREICDEEDILLIFDEVMTGFRLAKGGAQELMDISADIVTYGKVIGGGMPVGAYGARSEIMELVAPVGPVYQAGTLSGNPVAMTAGFKTLSILNQNPQIYSDLETNTAYLAREIESILLDSGLPFRINQVGSMISLHFCSEDVIDFDTASLGNNELFKLFFHQMLKNGIYLPPSAFESWFLSMKHESDVMDQILEATRKSINVIKEIQPDHVD